MNWKNVLLVGTVLFMSACSGMTTNISSTKDLVQYLDGSIYQSIDKYEIGMGKNEIPMGHWSITFDKDTYLWGYSDVVERGRYLYVSETEFLVQSINSSRSVETQFERFVEIEFEKEEIIWKGIRYKKVIQ